jgi:hypothetical protein
MHFGRPMWTMFRFDGSLDLYSFQKCGSSDPQKNLKKKSMITTAKQVYSDLKKRADNLEKFVTTRSDIPAETKSELDQTERMLDKVPPQMNNYQTQVKTEEEARRKAEKSLAYIKQLLNTSGHDLKEVKEDITQFIKQHVTQPRKGAFSERGPQAFGGKDKFPLYKEPRPIRSATIVTQPMQRRPRRKRTLRPLSLDQISALKRALAKLKTFSVTQGAACYYRIPTRSPWLALISCLIEEGLSLAEAARLATVYYNYIAERAGQEGLPMEDFVTAELNAGPKLGQYIIPKDDLLKRIFQSSTKPTLKEVGFLPESLWEKPHFP